MKARKSIGKKITIFLVLILLVAIVGLAVFWFYIKPKNEKPVTPPDTSTSVVAQMKDQIAQLNANMENMMIVLYDKEMTIQTMSVELGEATEELNSTKRAMDVLCDEIEAKNAEILELGAENEELKEQLKADIEELKTKYSELQIKISDLEVKITKNETDISSIQEDVKQIKEDISNLQSQVADLQKSIDELKANIVQVVESGSNYIRYSSGIQTSWGNANTDTFVSFGKAFKDTNYSVVCTYTASTSAWENVLVTWKGTDSCYVASGQTNNKIPFNYLAIGYWK